jgi:hypothetical protein
MHFMVIHLKKLEKNWVSREKTENKQILW